MTGCIVGADRDDLEARRRRLAEFLGRPVDEVGTGAAAIVGTVDEAVERLRELEQAGVERVMLQHLLHEDVEMVELLGREVATAV